MRLRNGFESGPSAALIIPQGSGNPDPWDATLTSGQYDTALYDTTHARGVFAGKFSTQSSGDQVGNVEWRTASFGTQTGWYGRLYLYLSANPGGSLTIAGATDGAGSVKCRIQVTSAGKLLIAGPTGGTLATDTVSIALNQWVRLEWHLVHDLSAGSFELRVFETNAEAAVGSYDRVLSVSSVDSGASAFGAIFGVCTSLVSAPAFWLDTVEVNNTGWAGPDTDAARTPPSFLVLQDVSGFGDVTSAAQIADYSYIGGVEAADRLQLVSHPVRRGAGSLLVEVRTNDTDHDGLTDRTEAASPGFQFAPGDDFWLGYSVILDPTFPTSQSHWLVLFQLYGSTGGQTTGAPPFAIEIDSDHFLMTVRGGIKATPSTSAPRSTGRRFASATRGIWHDFKFHLKLAKDATGQIDAYHKRGSETAWPSAPNCTDTGINVLTVAGVDQWPSPEGGIYRETRAETGIAYVGLIAADPSESIVESYFPSSGATDLGDPGLLKAGGDLVRMT
jgi:hypothetical protein